MAACLVEELTVEQEEILEQFVMKVTLEAPEIEEKSSINLAKWLVARNFDQEAALQMLRDDYVWRKESLNHYYISQVPLNARLRQRIPGGFFGHTRIGHPVFYCPIGHLDIDGIRKSFSFRDLINDQLRKTMSFAEECCKKTEETGTYVDQCLFVLDLEGYSLSNLLATDFVSITRSISQDIADHFPETVFKVFIVNGSKAFNVFYKIFASIMTDRIRQNIVFLPWSTQREELLKFIEPDQLPEIYGGEAIEDGQWIQCPEPIPEEDYFKKSEDHFDEELWTYVYLGRGQINPILIVSLSEEQVADKGLPLIEWQVHTKYGDLYIGLSFHTEQVTKVLSPPTRMNTQFVVDKGQYQCLWPGDYYLDLNNSGSLINSPKDVYYQLSVLYPNLA